MISVQEAKQLIHAHCKVLQVKLVDLYEANACVLAEDLYATSDSPPFHQSAMDGYAFRFEESKNHVSLEIIGEVAAGENPEQFSQVASAVRIFTGAKVPETYDTVIMQEKVELVNEQLFLKDPAIKKGMNIRLQGSQIKAGDLALKTGVIINPGMSAYIACLGFAKIKVIPKARVSIISTGNELNAPGTHLEVGKVFECNTYSLNAALIELGIHVQGIHAVLDNQKEIEDVINDCLQNSDLIILSGGVSVGKYDFVAPALNHCGVKTVFHKIKQKPGKPMFFGTKDHIPVFGLPGNPASLLTCFYEYVLPALNCLMDLPASKKKNLHLPLLEAYQKKPGLTHFLKARLHGNQVEILQAQESYLMSSFAMADCIAVLEEEKSVFEKGDLVEVHIL
ncbi:MAG: gephyrin-like molybdotransferase Glp [Bacteroidota bacterium]